MPPRPVFTAQDLERWEENGAGWQLLSADGGRVYIELCTCHGEAVDVVEANADLVRQLSRTERP